jgi:pilus assembly protein CpaB
LIQPNSRVDVLVTIKDANSDKQVSKLFMENMRVLSVGTEVQRGADGRPISAGTATLEVTPTEAERLAIAASQGSLQLVLRGYGDPDSIETRGATSADVLTQLRVAPAVVPKPAATRPVRVVMRPVPPPPPAPVVAPPPARPDSVRVQVYRGSKVTVEKFEKDTAGSTSP